MTGFHENEVPVQHRARSTVTSSTDVQGILIVNLPLTICRWWLVANLLLRYGEIFFFFRTLAILGKHSWI